MLKLSYVITLLSGLGLFNSCAVNFVNLPNEEIILSYLQKKDSAYGNYLAGRVAHIRQDYNNASYYYAKSIERGLKNKDLLGKTYIILASLGDVDKSVKYANIARQDGDDNTFIDVINAVYEFQKGNYRLSRNLLNKIDEKTYKNLINPLFNAWSYVGENNYDQALKELNVLSKSEEMFTVYHLHSGLIAEYFKDNQKAETHYQTIIDNNASDISFRALQLISNFMVRNNKKKEALGLINRFYGSSNIKEMLSSLSNKVKESSKKSPSIVNTPQSGISEVFLEIGLLFKSIPAGYDYAQIYMAFSKYFNPNNDVTKIALAGLFEDRLMYDDANSCYDSIGRKSEMYYPAQMKKAQNLSSLEKYDEALVVLKKLLKDNPENFQILFNLGDISRYNNDQISAIEYYNKAIDSIFYETDKYWPVYYALAISYDKNNEWVKAEEKLSKALKLSNRHPHVLNYLGYSWLKTGIKTDLAVEYIVEAYEKSPNDGFVLDSLGWVYYKTGDYKNAINFLERASELDPQNAVISDHLGDAYWLGGRKNEAVFQWKQALKQKDDYNELNIKKVKSKIKSGLVQNDVLTLENEKTSNLLKNIENITH